MKFHPAAVALFALSVSLASGARATATPTQTPSPTASATATASPSPTPTATASLTPGAQPLNLGAACGFAVLAGAAFTTGGGTASINGDIGAVTETFNGPVVLNGVNQNNNSLTGLARNAMDSAFSSAMSLASVVLATDDLSTDNSAGLQGGTFAPGVYSSPGGAFTSDAASTLILDAGGNTSAVFIFLARTSYMTLGADTTITLTGGALAQNVFWVVAAYATTAQGTNLEGNILTGGAANNGYITVGDGGTVVGSLMSMNDAVNIIGSDPITITDTACPPPEATDTASPSPSPSPDESPTSSPTETGSPTATPDVTQTATYSSSASATASPSATPSAFETGTMTFTVSGTPSATRIESDTPTLTASSTYSATSNVSSTQTFTVSATPTLTADVSPTGTATPGVFAPSPAAIGLGSAGGFSILAGTEITNTGASSTGGYIGVYPGTVVTGSGTLVQQCTDFTGDGTVMLAAQNDLTTAYNNAMGLSSTDVIGNTNIGGATLPTGVYESPSAIMLAGTLTLDGGGNPNAVFVFQATSELTVGNSSQVLLINGAQAQNVFWVVGSSASLGTSVNFVGTILALDSITVGTSSDVDGRLLARNGLVSLEGNVIVSPVASVCSDFSATPNPQTPSPSPTGTPGLKAGPSASPTPAVPGAAASPQALPTPPAAPHSYFYPSPSRGSVAAVAYNMTDGGEVTLRIYNQVGNLVDTIRDSEGGGWQSSSVSVGKFATGIYYYVLSMHYNSGANETDGARKFVVLH